MEWPGFMNDEIRDMITTQVTMEVSEAIPQMFGSFKTMMIEIFEECYAAVSEVTGIAPTTCVAITGFQRRQMT